MLAPRMISDTSDDLKSTNMNRTGKNVVAEYFSLATTQIRADTCKSSEQTCPVANRRNVRPLTHSETDITGAEHYGVSLPQLLKSATAVQTRLSIMLPCRQKGCYLQPVQCLYYRYQCLVVENFLYQGSTNYSIATRQIVG
jgi:hypothetical protein